MESFISEMVESHMLGICKLPLHVAYNASCSQCISHARYLYDWRGRLVCDRCYLSSQEQLMENVVEYISACGLNSCKICGTVKQRVFGFNLKYNKKPETKNGGVMSMVHLGVELDHIKSEIDRCHLLCADCYFLVVSAEVACGFTAGEDV